jgi:hypothetical protein
VKKIIYFSCFPDDQLSSLDGMAFTATDRDNDNANGNCALGNFGIWWYDNCATGKFTGDWGPLSPGNEYLGIWWGGDVNLRYVAMMIKVA